MRIAVSCHPTQGGSGIVATELATALAHRGHQVHLAATQRPYRLAEDSGVVFHAINVPNYPLFPCPPHDLSLANKLAGIVKEFGVDIIHAHYAIPHAVIAILARAVVAPRRVRVVTTLHGTDITLVGSHAEFYALTCHAMTASDGLTAVSDWLRDETMARFRLPQPPEVIHNFVDTRRFHPRDRVGYPEPGGDFFLLHASNLRPVKRVADVVRVFHEVQKRLPARLTILGAGPEKGLAEELVAELNLTARVTFTETAQDMPAYLRAAHVNLLLSDNESFGLSALEGLACGTPVAASDAGGLPEVVQRDCTGLLCPVGDVTGTARAIVDLLSDRPRWEAMSRAAAEDAVARFSVEQIVPAYERLYERVLAQNN
jgi:N-acetyl-alpha-D-glucosaminyl L-malate synthase BshA